MCQIIETGELQMASKHKWHATSANISWTEICHTVPSDCRGKEQSRGANGIADDHYCPHHIPTTPLDSTAKSVVCDSGVLNSRIWAKHWRRIKKTLMCLKVFVQQINNEKKIAV